ncbi:hypothetical protein [Sagittula stellata]|uniref:Uncharacterized protein n=1 Tax=Sagittula stellata (strain ATCC 700073 / DSM 11524 / E-37) TaxID=388399 RepID=A3K5I5_SAGS3|nr:hypothetical protein [Sagittula stellata]EBA07374.1 hypothetical protein SSE37_21285 [Sagittula stellata E-37]
MTEDAFAWLFLASFILFIVVAGALRLRKKEQIRRTISQHEDGSWMWTDRKGESHRSHTNPLDDMAREEKRGWEDYELHSDD